LLALAVLLHWLVGRVQPAAPAARAVA